MGLLDLPEGALHIIKSLLDPLSLASVRLACQTLYKAATSNRRLVVKELDGWYTAKARASPRVLTLMHTFESLQADLGQGGHGVGEERGIYNLSYVMHRFHTRAWLHKELLASAAREVEFFCIGASWRLGDRLALAAHEMNCQPHILISKMSALTAVVVERPLDMDTLHELVCLRHLACLKVRSLHSTLTHDYLIRQLCSMPALTRLDLGTSGFAHAKEGESQQRFDTPSMLSMLTSGRVEGLQNLAIPIPRGELQHLDMLTALSALTSLHVRLWGSTGNWSSLSSLTGLKLLRMESKTSMELDPSAGNVLAPLVVLQRLTHLDLAQQGQGWDFPLRRIVSAGWDFSALSYLTALRVLRCDVMQNASFVG